MTVHDSPCHETWSSTMKPCALLGLEVKSFMAVSLVKNLLSVTIWLDIAVILNWRYIDK